MWVIVLISFLNPGSFMHLKHFIKTKTIKLKTVLLVADGGTFVSEGTFTTSLFFLPPHKI